MNPSEPADSQDVGSPRSVFRSGGGVTGALFRSIDWSRSSMGPIEQWPMSLKGLLNMVFSAHEPMILFWGPEHVQFYNDAYLPTFDSGRYPVAMGQRGCECWPEIWQFLGPQIDRVMAGGEAITTASQRLPISRNGVNEAAYWSFGHSPVFDDAGRIGGVLVACTETTDQVLTTQLLSEANVEVRAARDELQRFLMQLPVGVAFTRGSEHVLVFANPTFMSLVFGGENGAEHLGKALRASLSGQGVHELLDGVYAAGQPFVGAKIPVSVNQGDGKPRDLFVNFICQTRRDPKGRVEGLLLVVYEVTDQVNEQREIELLATNLRDALTARDTFMAVASHELKTPLTSLKLQAQIAQRRLGHRGGVALSPYETATLLERTLAQTDRLERVVNDMLDASRISSGKLTLHRSRANLSSLVALIIGSFETEFDRAGCEVSSAIAPAVMAEVDASRVEQVVTNFITNALKYARGKALHVRVGQENGMARVSVRDEGPGIPAADQHRIFERFERATPGHQISGLGLGLYISKQIVVQHGGQIFVESAPGQGAEFGFLLPLNEAVD